MELKFEQVSKNYKDKKVLKDISVTMGTGVYGILGPNGAGKTTMIKIMADVLRPDTGRILYDGQDIHIIGDEYRAKVGYLPQEISFYGTLPESNEEPYGINTLQSKISELKKQGQQNTFEYKKLYYSLQKLTALGEPEFANILLWENLFTNWGEHMMQFLLLIPLAFLISPIFVIERSSGMDHLILSSRHGRRKIVTAKLLSVLITSTVIVMVYLIATFVFGFLPHASLHGWDAAIQSIPEYARSMFGFKVWQFAVVSALWLIFTGAVYSLIISFISSRMKSQMSAVGISLAILFINVGLAAMGDGVLQRIQPIIDFGLANVTLIKEVFGGYKVFNVFGMIVSYPIMAVFVLGLFSVLAVFGIYRGQKHKTVV